MMFKQIVICVFCLASALVFGQEIELEEFKNTLSKTETYYQSKESYSIDVTYAFYETGKQNPKETKEGKIIKKNSDYYSKIGETEFIYIRDNFLKINNKQKAILFIQSKDQKPATPVEVSTLIAYFDTVSLHKKEHSLVYELSFKQLPEIPYEKMILEIDASTFAMLRQELYFIPNRDYPWENIREKTLGGKLVVTLQEKKTAVFSPYLFNLSTYIHKGNTITLSEKYSSYKLYNTNP